MPTNAAGSKIGVTTLLGHSSGQWIESTFHVEPARFDAQGAGSAVTYLRRYSLMSILGIAAEDDDGEGAVAGPPPAAAKFTPAVRKPGGDTDRARTAVVRIRNEIQNAVYLEELDAKGINGASAQDDERIINAQPGGHNVWQDLMSRDTKKRQQLTDKQLVAENEAAKSSG
jgi:hypothetical protein